MKPETVIAMYRPFKDKSEECLNIVKSHYNILNINGFVTDMKPIILQSTQDDIVEIRQFKCFWTITETELTSFEGEENVEYHKKANVHEDGFVYLTSYRKAN